MNVSEIIAAHRPRVARVAMMFDGQLADDIKEARAAWRSAIAEQATLGSAEVDAAKHEVDRLESLADDQTVVFVFQAVSKKTLDEIKAKCPPTEDVWERYKVRLSANPMLSPPEFEPEAFSIELIAASCVDPAMTVTEAAELLDTLSDGDVARLFEAAWSVSMQGSDRPLSRTATSGT